MQCYHYKCSFFTHSTHRINTEVKPNNKRTCTQKLKSPCCQINVEWRFPPKNTNNCIPSFVLWFSLTGLPEWKRVGWCRAVGIPSSVGGGCSEKTERFLEIENITYWVDLRLWIFHPRRKNQRSVNSFGEVQGPEKMVCLVPKPSCRTFTNNEERGRKDTRFLRFGLRLPSPTFSWHSLVFFKISPFTQTTQLAPSCCNWLDENKWDRRVNTHPYKDSTRRILLGLLQALWTER